ncbi:HNH endonuclease signature motif containing protein, partial [Haematomicrobium sanguinis]|uniref:HNH endonuclease signature motif containing protein n=1 Tax=Haematomicrobium sanguinis TaxID=479106 RepID=UPI00146FB579
MAQTELGVRTSAVARLACGLEKLMHEFQQDLRNPLGAEPTVPASPSTSTAASDAHKPDAFKRDALGAVRVLERAQVQVEAAMHLAAGVALSVEAEEQERLLDLPLDERIGRNKGRRGSGRGKHQDAFTVTPPTNASTSTAAGSSSTSADPASASPRGSAFFPGFDSRDVEDSEVAFPRVWCGVSVKAMDEALWGLGSELALLWGRSEFVTTGMLIDTATLSRLPKLEARFITGLLNSRLVKTAVKHCVGLTDEQAASYDARLHEFMFPVKYDVTGQYPVRSANDVAKFAEVTRNRLHAEPLAVRERREMKHRYVSISNESNGMCSISGLLPATAAHRFMNTLTDFAITAKTEHDTRTLKQLIADVFTDLITHNYNHSYPNTPPNPAETSGAGPDASQSTGSTGGTERTSAPAAPSTSPGTGDSAATGPSTGGASATSASETDSGSVAEPGSWPPRDHDPADTGPGGSAPTERLSYDAVHDLFDQNTTPDARTATGFEGTPAPDARNATGFEGTTAPDARNATGFEGTTAPETSGEGTRVPDSGNGSHSDASPEPETVSGSRSGLRGEAKIFVTIPATTLAGLDEQDGMLSGYGPIPADAIRELAGTAHTLYRIFTDPNTGRPLALGRSSYRVDTQLREFLQLRSDTCQFPGCGVNARRTDADHITEWDTGGETNPENLQLLCRKHHNLKTHHGWQAKVLDPETNTIQWTSPLCNTYLTEPVGTGT